MHAFRNEPDATASKQAASSDALRGTRRDGRDARWEAHRATRRRQLIEQALRAIRKHGPAVGMDDIAAQAGTSKTVLYRHFGDRSGIHQGVTEAVDELILGEISTAAHEGDTVADQIAAMADAYLRLVERDPDIYRFVVARPAEDATVGDPVRRLTDRVGSRVTGTLLAAGVSDPDAAVWGPAIVGLIQTAADRRLATGSPATVEELTGSIMRLLTPALAGVPTGATTIPDTTISDTTISDVMITNGENR